MSYVENQEDKDLVLFSCDEKNVTFYKKCGWEFNDIPILEGQLDNPKLTDARVELRFISEKALQYQDSFVKEPFYFGDELW